jgi:hypothetical protein
MKRLIIIVLVVVVIGIAFYFGYQKATEQKIFVPQVQEPELPATTESVSKETLIFKQKWNVGERQVMRMEVVSDTETKSSNKQVPPMKIIQNVTEDVSFTTVTTRPEGGYEVAFQIEQFRMEMDMNTVKMVFDSNSESTSVLDKQIGEMGGLMRGMVNKKITMMVAADGKVDSVSGITEMMDAIKKNPNNPANTMLESIFNEDYFKNMIDHFTPGKVIPQHPIQVGESWTNNKEMNIPSLGKTVLSLNYTFTGWKEYEGVTCAVLNYTGVIKTTPGSASSNSFAPGIHMNVSMNDTKFAGYSFVDPVKGVVVEAAANQIIPMEMKMKVPSRKGPQEQTIYFLIKQQTKTTLLKGEQVSNTNSIIASLDTTALVALDTTSNP